MLKPLNFQKWIDEHRNDLKPPVGNMQVWPNREFMVTVVAGPNARSDFHINEGEEYFHQLEGTMLLRMLIDGKIENMPIGPGEIFLLPAKVPHSPQRPSGTLGVVIERRRLPQELDGFVWYCEKCHEKMYEEFLHVTDIVRQLPPVFDRFFGIPENCKCGKCGWVAQRKPSA